MTRPAARRLLTGPVLVGCVVAACAGPGVAPAAAETPLARAAHGRTSQIRSLDPASEGSTLLGDRSTGSQVAGLSSSGVGTILDNRPLPGNGGLQVTFQQDQYGGSGADGIGFFLVEGGTNLTGAGAGGGSLGYAPRNATPGVDGGYLGVGLDASGGYADDAENRGNGCVAPEVSPVHGGGQVPDSVVLRGPGEGLTGYCYLDGTLTPDASKPSGYATTLPGTLRADGDHPAAPERTVRVTVGPGAFPMVTVQIDFEDGKGFQTVLSHRMAEKAPPTYKFGFSSAGGSTGTHQIRDVEASSLVTLDRLNLVKTVVDAPEAGYNAGDTVHYQFLVTNTGTSELDGVTVDDPAVTDVSCPSATLNAAGSPTASMVCTGSHVLTPADTQTGQFENTATANAVPAGGGTVASNPSNPSSAEVEVTPAAPHLVIAKTADPDPAHPGDTVTHTLTVTNHSGFPLDSASVTDDLSDVVSHAVYDDDETASTGTVTTNGTDLRWTGSLADGATATIQYSVTVADGAAGQSLVDRVGSETPGAVCADDSAVPCVLTVPVEREPVTRTGSSGPPGPGPGPHGPGSRPEAGFGPGFGPGFGLGNLAATGVAALLPVAAVGVSVLTFGFVLYRRTRTRTL